MEFQAAKEDGYLPGLAYLDTARGINPIVEKLPHYLQEELISRSMKYKECTPPSLHSGISLVSSVMRRRPETTRLCHSQQQPSKR